MERLLRYFVVVWISVCFFSEQIVLYAANAPAASKTSEEADASPSKDSVNKKNVAKKIISPASAQKNSSFSEGVSMSPSRLISLDYTNANLGDVLKAVAYSYDLNIVVIKDLSGKVSAKLKDLTLDDALNAILDVNNYGFMRKGDIVYVMPKADMDPFIESVPINYLTAKEAKDMLGKATAKGSVQPNESTNSLIVKGTASEIRNIKELIKIIDVPPIQVLIEARIVDISNDDAEKIGTAIKLNYDPTKGHITSTSFLTGSTTKTVPPGDNSEGTLIGVNSSWQGVTVDTQIDALVTQHRAHVLASPSIATLNGKEASITIGQKVAFISSTATTGSTSTNSTSFADIGTKLRVTPTVSSDGWITMKVHPEVSSLLGLTIAGPNISTREADATVRVRDNQTIVIGGLINRSDLRDNNGIPYLKDIPFLGGIFRRHSNDFTNGNLTVFITPHVIPMPVHFDPAMNVDVDMLGGLLKYVDSLEKETSKDPAKNIYLSLERIKAYRMIVDQFPKSGKTDYCLYKIALIYAKEFNRCDSAQEALIEMKESFPQSAYMNVTESLVGACIAVSDSTDEPTAQNKKNK